MKAIAHVAGPGARLLPGLLLLAALLYLMRDTASAMVAIWIRAETFTHAFLVPPIVLWLVWRQRAELAALPLRPAPWLLVPMGLLCFGWLVGTQVSVAAAAQFAFVGLIVLAVPAMFGWLIARQIAFPLLFLFFAVPFGDFTAPQLMVWTADFTVLALRVTGIPVYREGMQFVIPTGSWSVVEACSGVRYLIASLMVGTLYAYLNYRSTKRRLIFVALSIGVPLLANWLRAYMIVMIGHLSDNRLAVGVDHLLYGWVFFGVVVGLLYMIGARWAEPDPPPSSASVRADTVGDTRSLWAMAAGVLLLLLATQAWAWRLAQTEVPMPPLAQLPAQAGWRHDTAALPWTPGFDAPSAVLTDAYLDGDRPVWMWLGVYLRESDDSTLVSSTNTLVKQGNHSWSQVAWGERRPGAGLPSFRTGQLREGRPLTDGDPQRLLVWQVYRVGDRWVASDAKAKLWQAAGRLRGRAEPAAVLLLATPMDTSAEQALEKFARAHLDAIEASLRGAR